MTSANVPATPLSFFQKVVAFFEGEATTVETELSDLEQRLLPGFSALVKQIEETIGAQGVTILEQGLTDIGTVIASGGNVGLAISALVPEVTAQIKEDLQQDATNAAHGAVSLILAALPASAGQDGTQTTVAQSSATVAADAPTASTNLSAH